MAKYLPFKKIVVLNNCSLTVYSIGWLAYLTKRHPGTMRNWEREGLLPLPIFDKQIDPLFRYYTAGELMGYAKLINSVRRERGKPLPANLKTRLHAFRDQLKQQMKEGKNLALKFSDEERIESALKNNVDARERRTAKELLKASGFDNIDETKTTNETKTTEPKKAAK